MRLIPNWRAILLKSWSMRLTYAGLAVLAVPEALYMLTGWQWVSPYWLGWSGLLIPMLTILGRIIDQGIGDK